MKIEYAEAVSRFTEFMADNVAKVPDLGRRFLMYAALGAARSNPEAAGAGLKVWLNVSGVLDGNGMLDVELAENALTEAFEKIPKVTFAGFTFTQDDADALLDRMRG